MTAKAQIVYVGISQLATGLMFGESKQVTSLHMSARSIEELERKTPIVLAALLKEQGRDVRVIPVECGWPDTLAYVLLPQEEEPRPDLCGA